MRIGVISASRIPSRAANSIQVMKVCQSFLDLGHKIHLWVPGPRPEDDSVDMKTWYGLHREVPITWVPCVRSLRRYDFAWKAVRQGERWEADLVYCWPLQAAALSASRGIPTALEVHDRPQGPLGPWLLKTFLQSKGAKRLLPITRAMQDWIADAYAVSLEKPFCVIAPMGVNLEQFEGLPEPDQARKELGLSEGFTVGYTGHLYGGRGLDLMVELAQRNPEVHFLWVGGEPEAVEHWRQRLGERDITNVRLVGFVANEFLPLYQAACEVLLMPYERHIAGSSGGDTARFASPMKVFEYMASGRAILTSDLPVLREVLHDDMALLLDSTDIDAWDQALKALIQDRDRRMELGRRAQSQVGQYRWRARAERTLAGLGNG